MLDMKRTFDDLVARFADTEEGRERILGNRIYQHVSDALAGSAEYSAMEKVFELSERRDFDLIVVDTPPSQHALDFLEAPRRLVEFLDSRLVQVLLHPAFAAGRFGVKLFQRGTERVLRLVERVSGVAFLEDISEFLLAFEAMSEGFRERAREVQARLLGPDAAFVLAASPAQQSTRHALDMLARLSTAGVPLAGLVVNRVHVWPDGTSTPERVPEPGFEDEAIHALASALALSEGASFPADVAARAALAAADGYAAWVRADATSTAELTSRVTQAGGFVRRVPELSGDVHDLEGLARVAAWVFRTEPIEAPNGEQ
jgi:anion-transporting  ArsA/GET3 family ATPase